MLDPKLQALIDEQQKKGGVEVPSLKPGTLVKARTRNTVYEIKILEDGVEILGGKYFPQFTETKFAGSTWGGSMIKMGWIGIGMHMEIPIPDRLSITTTAVREIKVIGPDWEYEIK